MSHIERTRLTAALLAGGRSSRMGTDKAWLPGPEGMPLWQMQLAKLEGLQPDKLLVSCRQEQTLQHPAADLVPDPPGSEGPLPALQRCLVASTEMLLVLAVDLPCITVPFLQTMVNDALPTGQGIVYRGRHGLEPLCAIYPVAVLSLLSEMLSGGERRLQTFVAGAVDRGMLRVEPLTPDMEPLFLNMNTPAERACLQPSQ